MISVSPSLKLFAEVGKLDNQDYIGLLLEQGKMNNTQRKIYDDYKKSSLMGKKQKKGEFFEKRDSNLGEE